MSAVFRPDADRDSTEWWAALAKHRLLIQRCDNCRRLRWPPRAMCAGCGTFGWGWIDAGGGGTVVSWITTRRAFLPGLEVPYVVLLVGLDEQPDLLLPGSWDGASEGSDLQIGLPVQVAFRDAEPDLSLLSWRRADQNEVKQ